MTSSAGKTDELFVQDLADPSPGGGGETPTAMRRSSSVRLDPKWLEGLDRSSSQDFGLGGSFVIGGPPELPILATGGSSSQASKSSLPTDIIAFFPLPAVEEDAAVTGAGDNNEVELTLSPPVIARRVSGKYGDRYIIRPSAVLLTKGEGEGGGGEHSASSLRSSGGSKSLQVPSFPEPPDMPPKTPEVSKQVLSMIEEQDNNLKIVESLDLDDLSFGSVVTADPSEFSERMADEIWEDVPMGPPDAILGIAQAYKSCTDPRKVNVCVGAYRDETGQPWILPSVRQAERVMLENNENKEYLPIEGDRDFIEAAMKFAYGPDMLMDNLAAVQTLSGTGACRIGGEFLAQFWRGHPIYLPDPTWGNHIAIFKNCGMDVRRYRYYSRATNGLDLRAMLHDLIKAPDGSIILFHACAHNPTGCDPTIDEWKQIISVVSRKEHVVFFDSAYQGFASGDAEADAQPFRYAVAQHIPILLAQSFAKNFGLYGERVGTLSVVCGDKNQKERILSELKCIIRPMYSSPPRHGSSIVKTVLMDETLTEQYRKECAKMAARIKEMRVKLVQSLKDAGSEHDWSHILKQIGMFAFTGLNVEMSEQLTKEFAIFLTTNGRISVAGLNDGNVQYVAEAIHAVSHGKKITD